MIYFALFGKPLGYESLLFRVGKDQSACEPGSGFPEPDFKPTGKEEKVLHYSVRDGQASLSLYIATAAYNDVPRDGQVFGIALVSDRDIDIPSAFRVVLGGDIGFGYFESRLLVKGAGRPRFKSESLNEQKGTWRWTPDDLAKIQSVLGTTPPHIPAKKGTIIIYDPSPEFEAISTVAQKIKDYSNVYITNDRHSCKELPNAYVWDKSGKKLYCIKDGDIVEWREPTPPPPPPEPTSGKESSGSESSGYTPPPPPPDGGDGAGPDWRKILKVVGGIVAAVAVIVLAFLWFAKGGKGKSGPVPVDSIQVDSCPVLPDTTVIVVTFNNYADPVKESLPNVISSCSGAISPGDIELAVDRTDLVEVKNNRLTVKKKPDSETMVVVKAHYDGKMLNATTYTIAGKGKAAAAASVPSQSTKLPAAATYTEPVKVYYSEGTASTWHDVNSHVAITVKDKNNVVVRGTWTYPDGIMHKGNNNVESWEMWATKPGTHTLTFTYKNGGKTEKVDCLFRAR
ncbi:MAG: hypothetical protein IJ760_01645 [Bacteroidales bacterium]|nr:hypothetical protein [Bacteroidales bacterium]